MKYVLGIDQSTQGTKLILFDENGNIFKRLDYPHKQIINELGYISHDMNEIYSNIIKGINDFSEIISLDDITCVGITNQRETTIAWDNEGIPLDLAIVWQCKRADELINNISFELKEIIYKKTGLPLSPFFPLAKIAWFNKYSEKVKKCKNPHFGTVDSYLIYRLTKNESFYTDYSNASRTQLFNINTLTWDKDICGLFDIDIKSLPNIIDSNGYYGETDFEGILNKKIPILSVMGDSHSALYAQGCHNKGTMKATYGTGSSIMLNTGDELIFSSNKLASSVSFAIDGKINYALEGNVNYSGAVISWLKNDLELINSLKEIEKLIEKANQNDETIMVPAFTGLSAPHWNNDAKAIICNMTPTTKKAELVKAAVESIAYQVNDVISAIQKDFKNNIVSIKTDGGPTKNKYLMQFQADLSACDIYVSNVNELSAMGVAYMAGIKKGIYDKNIFTKNKYLSYTYSKDFDRIEKINNWNKAIKLIIEKGE